MEYYGERQDKKIPVKLSVAKKSGHLHKDLQEYLKSITVNSDNGGAINRNARGAVAARFAALNYFAQIPIYGMKGECDMVNGIPNISVAYMLPHTGRMSLPVDSSSLVYSYFQHVSGIAAPADTQGQTITKLNLLDVLIGQVNKMKGETTFLRQNEGIDAVLESLRAQLEQAKTASAAMPYFPSPDAPSGALLNLTA